MSGSSSSASLPSWSNVSGFSQYSSRYVRNNFRSLAVSGSINSPSTGPRPSLSQRKLKLAIASGGDPGSGWVSVMLRSSGPSMQASPHEQHAFCSASCNHYQDVSAHTIFNGYQPILLAPHLPLPVDLVAPPEQLPPSAAPPVKEP